MGCACISLGGEAGPLPERYSFESDDFPSDPVFAEQPQSHGDCVGRRLVGRSPAEKCSSRLFWFQGPGFSHSGKAALPDSNRIGPRSNIPGGDRDLS